MYNVIGMRIRGFTLVELLVSIGVLAVVMAGIFSAIGPGPKQYARDSRRKADLEQIRSAVELYRNSNTRYPGPSWKTDLTGGGYISSIPTDPKTAADYTYTPAPAGCTTSGTRCLTYSLCADLEKVTGVCDYTVTNP